MKVVVAFDKFKGTLSATEACHIAASSFAARGAQVVEKPLADGVPTPGRFTDAPSADSRHQAGEFAPESARTAPTLLE